VSAMTCGSSRITTKHLSRGTNHMLPTSTAGLEYNGTPSTLRAVAWVASGPSSGSLESVAVLVVATSSTSPTERARGGRGPLRAAIHLSRWLV
jgi:hypothetical protein